MKNKKIISFFLSIFIIVGSIILPKVTTNAQADITPPELKSISIDKTSVTAGESIQVTVNATDNGGVGLDSIYVCYISPLTKKAKYANIYTPKEGANTTSISLENSDESGIWKIRDVTLYDKSGNYVIIDNSKIYNTAKSQDFSNCDFEFKSSTTDVTPPKFNNISIDKTSVSSGESINVNVDAADDVPGTIHAAVHYTTPLTKQDKLVNLSLANGQYVGKIYITNTDEKGIWKISSIVLTDVSLNKTVIYNSKLGHTESGSKDLSSCDINVRSTVSFNSNGGTAVTSQYINYNAQAVIPEVPTKEGYALAGWYSDSELTTPYNFSTLVTGDITLYGKWVIKQDLNQDGVVDVRDIAELSTRYNKKSGEADWKVIYDLNKDGIIDIYDLVIEAKAFGNIPVQAISLDKTSLDLKVGGVGYLSAIITPSGAANKSVIWTTSNSGVATVDSAGKVTAISAGTAVITVATVESNKTASCNVIVSGQGNIIKANTSISQDTTITGDIIIAPGARLTVNFGIKLIINGDVYVYGELYNYGNLNISDTLYTNNYNNMFYGDSTLSNGIFMNFGYASMHSLSTYFPKGYSEN